MRGWLFVMVIGLVSVRPGTAQPRVTTPLPMSSPFFATDRGHPSEVLPAGTTVSQPLQPIEETPQETAPPATNSGIESADEVLEELLTPSRGLGTSWDSFDFLLWWPKSQSVPPLVTANRFAAPILGQPGTRLVIGGNSLGSQDQAGGRFVLGESLNANNTIGLEGVYFFLGSRTTTASVSTADNPRLGNLGFPFHDAASLAPGVLSIARPGISTARIDVSASTRVQGAELNLLANFHDGPQLRVNGLVGYRFFQLREGLRSESTIIAFPSATLPTGLAQTADQFDTHNSFSGGQLGLSMDASRGAIFVEFTGKLALGSNCQVVQVQGQTNTLLGSPPVGLSYPSGVYAEPTNIGRSTRSVFAVMPEAMFKIGLKLNERGRFFAGYNFLYLSDAVRPGDQIDPTLNASQIRVVNAAGSINAPDRPQPFFNRTDFWVQGLVLGLEGRY